jgi:hypothetical protein
MSEFPRTLSDALLCMELASKYFKSRFLWIYFAQLKILFGHDGKYLIFFSSSSPFFQLLSLVHRLVDQDELITS